MARLSGRRLQLTNWLPLVLVALLAACGPAAPAQPAAPAAQATTAAGPAATGESAEWASLVRAAQQEGRVTVADSALDPAWRAAASEAFGKRYNVAIEDISLASGELVARAKRERAAGQQTMDLYVGGAPSGWSLLADDMLEPMAPLLVQPEVTDPQLWRGGRLKILDPAPGYHLQTAEWVMTDLVVNSDLVDPRQITTWQDLLKPEYRGKIAAFDPRAPGPGQSTAVHLFARFGSSYLEKLYVGQQVQYTKDTRQLGEWLARGTYAVALSLLPATIETMTQEGFHFERVFPADAPGALTGGNGVLFAFKNAPHPHATQLFINWFASREGQDVWAKTIREPTLRTDVDLSPVPSYIVPRDGVDYKIDHYNYEFYNETRKDATDAILALLGR
ncbi:MAG TPA: extracellular solute-binding protein [Chloroflexota bacterium]